VPWMVKVKKKPRKEKGGMKLGKEGKHTVSSSCRGKETKKIPGLRVHLAKIQKNRGAKNERTNDESKRKGGAAETWTGLQLRIQRGKYHYSRVEVIRRCTKERSKKKVKTRTQGERSNWA